MKLHFSVKFQASLTPPETVGRCVDRSVSVVGQSRWVGRWVGGLVYSGWKLEGGPVSGWSVVGRSVGRSIGRSVGRCGRSVGRARSRVGRYVGLGRSMGGRVVGWVPQPGWVGWSVGGGLLVVLMGRW